MSIEDQAKNIARNVQGLNELAKEILIEKQIKDLETLRNAYLESKFIPRVKAPLHPLYGRRLNRDRPAA